MSTARATSSSGAYLVIAIVAVIDLVLLYGVTLMYAQGELAFAMLVLVLAAVGSWVVISSKGYNYRYVYPSLLGVITFIVFPLIYTVNVAFTNYSSNHLLSLERVRAIHLAKTYRTGGESFSFKMYQEGPSFRLMLTSAAGGEAHYLTGPFTESDQPQELKAFESIHVPTGAALQSGKSSKNVQLFRSWILFCLMALNWP